MGAARKADGRGKFCCKACRLEYETMNSNKINLVCAECGKKFKRFRCQVKSEKSFCSRECARLGEMGKKNHGWKGGISPERQSNKAVQWTQAIYKRDNYICQMCGAGRGLNAHHIAGWNTNPEFRYDMDNGVTMCVSCHTEFHKQYGKGDNSDEQFQAFVNDNYKEKVA